jgi:hypothetical protein
MEPGAEDEDNSTAGGAKYSENRDADPEDKKVCIIILFVVFISLTFFYL